MQEFTPKPKEKGPEAMSNLMSTSAFN
jgi:hypothetical protein